MPPRLLPEAINTKDKVILHITNLNLEIARTNRRLVERNAELSDKIMKLRGQRGWLIRQCRYQQKEIERLDEAQTG